MTEAVEIGFMAFLGEGREGIGAVREIGTNSVVIYVENAGEFEIPRRAIRKVHDQKVMLDPDRLPVAFLKAVGHAHDREDPKLVG